MQPTHQYLICGATSELAIALVKLLDPSIQCTLIARNTDKLQHIAQSLDNIATTHTCDLADDTAVKTLIKHLKSSKIKFDGVFCAAGAHTMLPLRLYSKNKFSDIMDSNFYTAANLLTNLSGILNPQASLVVTSSAVTRRGANLVAGYVAAKAAIEGLVRTAALEFAPKKIRINAIAPGVFHSNMSATFLNTLNADQQQALQTNHPLGIGTATDVAACVKFLLSTDAQWITGQTLIVDGGYTINA